MPAKNVRSKEEARKLAIAYVRKNCTNGGCEFMAPNTATDSHMGTITVTVNLYQNNVWTGKKKVVVPLDPSNNQLRFTS